MNHDDGPDIGYCTRCGCVLDGSVPPSQPHCHDCADEEDADEEELLSMRLHTLDEPDAGKRAHEAAEALVALLAELGGKARITGMTLCCDGCNIRREAAPTFDESRIAAHADGWITVDTEDYCPDCAGTLTLAAHHAQRTTERNPR